MTGYVDLVMLSCHDKDTVMMYWFMSRCQNKESQTMSYLH